VRKELDATDVQMQDITAALRQQISIAFKAKAA
jgi:hypothetical protein